MNELEGVFSDNVFWNTKTSEVHFLTRWMQMLLAHTKPKYNGGNLEIMVPTFQGLQEDQEVV